MPPILSGRYANVLVGDGRFLSLIRVGGDEPQRQREVHSLHAGAVRRRVRLTTRASLRSVRRPAGRASDSDRRRAARSASLSAAAACRMLMHDTCNWITVHSSA
jgi:hypothetical protein